MLSNVDVILLNLVNELAKRHRIEPCEFIATVSVDPNSLDTVLRYESPPDRGSGYQPQFDQMVRDVGCDDSNSIGGDPSDIYRALTRAIDLAPFHRSQPHR